MRPSQPWSQINPILHTASHLAAQHAEHDGVDVGGGPRQAENGKGQLQRAIGGLRALRGAHQPHAAVFVGDGG